jgi:hypothetical protein
MVSVVQHTDIPMLENCWVSLREVQDSVRNRLYLQEFHGKHLSLYPVPQSSFESSTYRVHLGSVTTAFICLLSLCVSPFIPAHEALPRVHCNCSAV